MKKTLLIFFVIACAASFVFLKKRENLEKKKDFYSKNIYKILNKKFSLNTYVGLANTYSVQSDEAYLRDDGPIHLKGKVRIRKNQGKKESLHTEEARIILSDPKSAAILSFSKVKEIELLRNVQIYSDRQRISTQRAGYDFKSKAISSSDPVRITGPGQILRGSKGFTLNLSNEELEIYGEIEGSFAKTN